MPAWIKPARDKEQGYWQTKRFQQLKTTNTCDCMTLVLNRSYAWQCRVLPV